MVSYTQQYADFITAQNKAMSPSNAMFSEQNGEDKAVTKKVEKHAGGDHDALHDTSHGDHHIYHGGEGSDETHTYHVHNSTSGKTSTVSLKGPDSASKASSKKEIHKQLGDQGQHTQQTVDHIHKDHKSSFGGSDEYHDYKEPKKSKTDYLGRPRKQNEGSLGFQGAASLGKSKDPRHRDAASHIDHHVRQNPDYHKSGDAGVKDRMRHASAKKLGYNV